MAAGAQRKARTERVVKVLNQLLRGKKHDRQSIATLVGVKVAAADEILRDLTKVKGVVRYKDGKRHMVRFDREALFDPPSDAAVLGACFGASLSTLFKGSQYEQGLRDMCTVVLERSRSLEPYEGLQRKFLFHPRGGEPAIERRPAHLDGLTKAVLRQHWVRLTYRHFDGFVETPRLQPLSLVIYEHQLYLVGRDEKGIDHPYRLARVQRVEVESTTFDYPPVSQYSPTEELRRSFGIFLNAKHPFSEVRVRLDGKWRHFVETHRWHPSQHPIGPGNDLVVAFDLRPCEELERWILSFGDEAEVLYPDDLRQRVTRRLRAGAAAYAARKKF